MTFDPTKETYLGDGLYCRFDGYHFRLRAPKWDGDHECDHEVALEPEVYGAFTNFVAMVRDHYMRAKTSNLTMGDAENALVDSPKDDG